MSAATFQYRVRDPLGKILEGSLEAATEDDAQQQLRRDGFAVLELSADDDAGPSLFDGRVGRSRLVYATSRRNMRKIRLFRDWMLEQTKMLRTDG